MLTWTSHLPTPISRTNILRLLHIMSQRGPQWITSLAMRTAQHLVQLAPQHPQGTHQQRSALPRQQSRRKPCSSLMQVCHMSSGCSRLGVGILHSRASTLADIVTPDGNGFDLDGVVNKGVCLQLAEIERSRGSIAWVREIFYKMSKLWCRI